MYDQILPTTVDSICRDSCVVSIDLCYFRVTNSKNEITISIWGKYPGKITLLGLLGPQKGYVTLTLPYKESS